jgi:hypothetical protein
MRKLHPPKVKGIKNSKKNKLLNITKNTSQTLKTFLVCCYVAIKVQRRFVEL